MKKILLLLVLLLAVLLPLSAGAATRIVDSGFGFYIGAGETLLPDYPDLAYLIGEGLTKDDFDIIYSTMYEVPWRRFDENGRCTIPADTTRPCTISFYMTYIPKVEGVGKETIFKGSIYVREPLTKITVLTEEVVLATDETTVARFRRQDGTVNQFRIVDYDSSIIDATLENESWNDWYWSVNITPKAVGETDIIVEAYNGLQATFHVKVTEPPSKLSFAQDVFTCYVGDTIDLGIDLGGGAMNTAPNISLSRNGGYGSTADCFPNTWKQFYAKEPGEYTITMTTYNDHRAETQVNVYSRENCVRLGLPFESINVGQAYVYIYAYDETGNKISPVLSITKGSDIARIVNGTLVASDLGTVEITATNPDGSTVSMTVEVVERPTQVFLNATELTMNIGDTFDFEVRFDKGKTDYKIDHYHDDYFPPFKLFPIRREGNRIIAQAPGTARIEVFAGHLNVTCYITVLDSDAQVTLNTPPEPFGVGDTFQLTVTDKTGKVYPAVYTNDANNTDPAAVVTPDGLVTGAWAGSAWIYATLEDGRVLHYHLPVKKVPKWMSHPDLTANLNHTTVGLQPIESDLGYLYCTDVYVNIEDKYVATFGGIHFEFHKPGKTVVTLTAINGGVKCSFILEVVDPDNTLYVPNTLIKLPSGYCMQLPQVTDYYGNIVPVTWEMTYEVPGQGNPEDYGFILEGDILCCNWPYAMCQVTGTAENGASIRLDVHGFRLAEEIRFQHESYTLVVGESKQTEIMTVEMGYEPGPIYWMVGDPEIISFNPASPSTGRPTATGLKPGTTTLTAELVNGVKATCTITVKKPILLGDANEDGQVDIYDALRIQQLCAGWGVYVRRENADVNGSGGVDLYDAIQILRTVAGQP